VRANLANPANTGAATCLKRRLLGLILLAAAIAMFATAYAARQATTSPLSIKRIQDLVDRGRVDAAEKQLWEIVTREPENTLAINLLGTIRTQQKRFPEAEALFKRILAITPDFVAAYRNLGLLYVLQERRDEAKIAYLKAHELEPRDAKTSLALGTLYEETNEFERSIEIINSIPAGLRPSSALPVLASDYFALRQPDKVAALTPLVRRAAASDPSVVPRFARVLVENGFVDDAEEILKATAEHQKLTPEYLLVLARVQERQGNLALAERTLARVAKLDPNSFDALFQSARLASQAKEYKKEAGLLGRALEIQPDHLEALRHLVLARMRSGDAAQAVMAARHLYSLRPEEPDALYLLGAALANHNEWHDARPIMEKLVSVRDDATAHVMLGMTLMNDGDIEGASQQIERALQQNPNEIEAHYYKGVIARQRGDLPGAIKEMEVVVRANPQHALAQVELGTLALQTGNLDRARQAFEQAVSLRPEVPENHYQLGLAYSRLGFQDKARVQMAEFQKLRAAADHPKTNSATSSDPPAENKPPSRPR
jgi:tetratricopeptide (TPR) repeat protein